MLNIALFGQALKKEKTVIKAASFSFTFKKKKKVLPLCFFEPSLMCQLFYAEGNEAVLK